MAGNGPPDIMSLNAIIHGDAGLSEKDVILRTISYLQSLRLLHSALVCECGAQMSLKERSGSTDQHCWRCPTKRCQKRRSVRTGSIFRESKLPLATLVHIFFLFAQDVPVYLTERMLFAHVSQKSILEWYEILRGKLSQKLINEPIRFFGEEVTLQTLQNVGDDIDSHITEEGVEFDESWFGKKAKAHRGTSRQNTIVFGIVARAGTKCSLRIVSDVQKNTLWPHILREIDQTCTIYSDGLATYQSLGGEGYVHRVVKHSEELVTPEGVHTNTIEGLWGLMKQRIGRMHGLRSPDRLAAHLDEFSFRHSYAIHGSIWDSLIQICVAVP